MLPVIQVTQVELICSNLSALEVLLVFLLVMSQELYKYLLLAARQEVSLWLL